MEMIMKGYNLDSFSDKDVYSWDEIIATIEELESEIRMLRDEKEKREQDIEDNFRRIQVTDQYGISEDLFI